MIARVDVAIDAGGHPRRLRLPRRLAEPSQSSSGRWRRATAGPKYRIVVAAIVPSARAAILSAMARGRADIANTALRIFLQEMGAAYDEERRLTPYNGSKDFEVVREFFGGRCCYCDTGLENGRIAQDHLIPMNKTSLGLHAWGNVVPACQDCNAKKQGQEWHAYLVERAGPSAAERYKRVREFVKHYEYQPDPADLRDTAEELYAEVGEIAMTLIRAKIKRVREKL